MQHIVIVIKGCIYQSGDFHMWNRAFTKTLDAALEDIIICDRRRARAIRRIRDNYAAGYQDTHFVHK